jgi:hypothetical protein
MCHRHALALLGRQASTAELNRCDVDVPTIVRTLRFVRTFADDADAKIGRVKLTKLLKHYEGEWGGPWCQPVSIFCRRTRHIRTASGRIARRFGLFGVDGLCATGGRAIGARRTIADGAATCLSTMDCDSMTALIPCNQMNCFPTNLLN